MTRLLLRATGLLVVGGTLAVVPLATPALAGNAVGGCTQSYTEYAVGQVASATNDPLAADVAPVVDANGDGFICYKPYPNGFHNNGAGGNLVDNTSGPHAS